MGDRDAALLAEAAARGVPADELTRLLDSVAEIVYGSFYAASDDAGSMQDLETVLCITARYGVRPPAPSLVADTRFADGHGLGDQADAAMVHRWRIAQDAG